jgi:hypothetical protein
LEKEVVMSGAYCRIPGRDGLNACFAVFFELGG